MFLKHLNQEKLKYQFQIKVIDLKFFEQGFKLKKLDLEHESFFISYQRGSKRKGEIESSKVNSGYLNWNSSFLIPVTIYKDKKGKILPKKLKFQLNSVK
jgi:hypothetical protein